LANVNQATPLADMNERDFEEITRFLTTVGKTSLFDYLSFDPQAPAGEAEQAIKSRRAWAQGQQANPKYRGEAIWVIKNIRLLRGSLMDARQQYIDYLADHEQTRGLEVLSLFIRGTLASGSLTPAGEAAILAQGKKLGLKESAVRQQIQSLAKEHGIDTSGGAASGSAPPDDFPNHYLVLGVPISATPDEIDHAYREKYRWARTLSDTRRSRDEYSRIDAALRDLKDPTRRAAYDDKYRAHFPAASAFDLDPTDGFLRPPTNEPSQASADQEPSLPSLNFVSFGGSSSAKDKKRRDTTEPPGTLPPIRLERSGSSAPPGARTISAPPQSQPRRPSPGKRPVTQPPGTIPPVPASHLMAAIRSNPGSTPPKPSVLSIPRPPERITGKTLSLGSQRSGTCVELLTPNQYSLRVGRRNRSVTIRLKQVGTGPTTGRIMADRDWVTVNPERLDAGQTQHQITATVHPDRMPRQRGSSIVTIVPSHGPRVTVTLDVERERVPRVLLIAGLVAVGALTLWGAGRLAYQVSTQPNSSQRLLQVDPDPPTAVVYLNDVLVGVGPHTFQGDQLPPGPVRLTVSLDGFQPFQDVVDPKPDHPISVQPHLELDQPLFQPTKSQEGVTLSAAAVQEQLQVSRAMFDTCFTAHADAPSSIKLRAFVGFSGHVQGLTALEPADVDPDFLGCISRGLHTMTFALSDPADYWTFETTLAPGH